MKFLVREKEFYRRFFTMAVVLILQNVITLSVNLADNIMLGAYSEASLSGVAAVSRSCWLSERELSYWEPSTSEKGRYALLSGSRRGPCGWLWQWLSACFFW